MGFAPQPGWAFPTLGILIAMYIGFFVWIKIEINKVRKEQST
jgi:hypothetical protein